MQKRNLLSTIALCAAIFSANAKVIYVTPDGSNANDGTTWEKSVADIQNAYKIAVSGDEIWVAEGVYDLSRLTPVESPVCMVEMKDNVDLYGGFKKGDTSIEARELVNENEPWNFKNLTVITASSDLSVRPFDRADKAVTSTWRSTIDGVKFEGIKTSNARVLYLNNGTTVNNVWMDGCRADGNNSTFLYLERGGVITNSLFENNLKAANAVAGVVQLRGSQAEEAGLIMDNCVFRNNDCTSLSVYVTAGNLKEDRSNDIIVTNTKFLNNNALSLNLNNGMGDYTGRVALVDNCYFEGNECASDASSNYDGSLAIISGVQSYLNRATIINNKNTAAEDADYKNSLIFVNNGVVSNSLIANNESAHASVSVVGTLVNSTIANNTGFVQLDKTGILFNTVVNNNADDKVKMINESTCILVASAFTNGALEGAADLEEGTVMLSKSPFIAPASFAGCAADEAQLAEIKGANYSLVENSEITGKGIYDEFLFNEEGLVEMIKDAFMLDLAGNARIENNQINIGCYQTSITSGITASKKENQYKVYNTDGKIFIESAKAEVKVISVSGSELYSATVNEGTSVIELSAKGMVIVVIRNANGIEAHKIIL